MSQREKIHPDYMWAILIMVFILSSCASELKVTPTRIRTIGSPVPTYRGKFEIPTSTQPPTAAPTHTLEVETSTTSLLDKLPSRIAYLSNQGIGILDEEHIQTQLVECNFFCETPTWSPDGKLIAFSASFEYMRTLQIYTVEVDTGTIKQITTSPKNKWGLSWSPDGKYLVYTEEGDPTDLVMISSDGKDSKKITYTPGYETFPTWSPVGDKIAYLYRDERFTKNSELWLMNPLGKNRIQVTDFPISINNTITWSPDGRSIAFISEIEDNSGHQCGQLYKTNVNENMVINLSQLSNFPGCAENPAWSPDGKYILFVGSNVKKTPLSLQVNWEIYLMRSDGSEWWSATRNIQGPILAIWDPITR